ncbi:toll/interleukin-1 receptor domain-containing protein [Leucothrix arctica]|uniref:TIR domain-containing protein n=1 Tax=Leucothrix arctica TaxID=1481894 RepID=A0A317C441_9GAMM|nr:toll/interleukin-1 receptor domain-containing protein [Leucothrix arctica]PWQ93456.1 hypothetical protein DKT75_17680 [Leucothrix arctica]
MTDLYISYSTRERHWVSKLVSALESDGYSVWWEHVAVLGDDIRPDSQTALEAAKNVLAIWSPLAVDDYWVLQDAKQAEQSGKLISVFYKTAELPSAFNRSDIASLKEWNSGDKSDAAYQEFVSTLKAIVRPSQPTESRRKEALQERKLRIQAEQAKRYVFTESSENRIRQFRESV